MTSVEPHPRRLLLGVRAVVASRERAAAPVVARELPQRDGSVRDLGQLSLSQGETHSNAPTASVCKFLTLNPDSRRLVLRALKTSLF